MRSKNKWYEQIMKYPFNPIPSKPFRSSICWKGNSFLHFCPKNHPPARRDSKDADWKMSHQIQQMAFKKIITSSLVLRMNESSQIGFEKVRISHIRWHIHFMIPLFKGQFGDVGNVQMMQVKPRRRQDMDDVGGHSMMENRLRIGQVAIDHWNLQSNHEPRMEPQPSYGITASYGCMAQRNKTYRSYLQALCLNIILSLSKRPRFM